MARTTIALREFRPGDEAPVRNLFVQSQRQYFQGQGYDSHFEANIEASLSADLADIPGHYTNAAGSNFWVAEAEGRIVGMGAVQRHDADTAELRRMNVDINWRRQGIAQRLLETAEAFAREHGYQELLLETSMLQDPAIALYEGNGYQRVGATHYGTLVVYRYAKALSPRGNPQGDGQS